MAGMTTAQRLSIAPGARLWFSPIEWLSMLGPLPPGVVMAGDFASSTVAIVFISDSGSARWFLDGHRTAINMPRALWICYPTLGSPAFNRTMLQTTLVGHGLQILGEVPFDASWTALAVRHFVPGQPPHGA